ncbi:hypothetical protein CRG98_035670 [Punica granatum]|uniref:Uncharacterized protein n=1 Tax=Punica granatum TaxID=22663 RepID=A0A2I0IJ41_PUNGR|nr:hypothetical protein CRG98_035670 [Punica granatum]
MEYTCVGQLGLKLVVPKKVLMIVHPLEMDISNVGLLLGYKAEAGSEKNVRYSYLVIFILVSQPRSTYIQLHYYDLDLDITISYLEHP